MIDSAAMTATPYERDYNPDKHGLGGQELILPEVVGALMGTPGGCRRVWLPFYSTGTLWHALTRRDIDVVTNSDPEWEGPRSIETHEPKGRLLDIDAVYFGTPTIVNNRPLFPRPYGGDYIGLNNFCWTAAYERRVVRQIVGMAITRGARRIVSGLGSGDITVEQRIDDMGTGAKVAAYKHFETFEDWVLVRDIVSSEGV